MSPKKSKATSKKTKQGHPARAASNQNIVSIDAYRVRSNPHEDTLFPIFTRWMSENHMPEDIGDPLPTLGAFMTAYKQLDATGGLTVLREPAFSSTLRVSLELLGEDATAQLLYTLLIYVLFLDDAGLWSGNDLEFSQARALLENLLGLEEDSTVDDEEIVVPALSKQQALEALTALPFAGRVHSFMEWFGEKRKVTANGMLTRQDIEGAAASLGVKAVGVSSSPSTLPLPAGEPHRATRAQDVPRLDIYWEALIAIGVIELNSKSASLYNSVAIFTDPQRTDELIMLLQDFARSIYERFATSRFIDAGRDQGLPYDLVAELLFDSCSELGFLVEDLTRFGQESDPTVAAPYAAAQLVLERLNDEGLIDIGESYTVPRALLKPVASVVGAELEIPVVYEDPRDEEPGYVGPEDGGSNDSESAATE